MYQAVVDLAGDPARREGLAAAAAAVVRQRYDWPALGDRLAAALFALLEGRLSGQARVFALGANLENKDPAR